MMILRTVFWLSHLTLLPANLWAEVDYQRDVRPLLATKCVSCHGPVKQEAGLRLDAGKLVREGSENGPIATPDAPADSLLLRRVISEAPEDRMPPASEGEPLTAEQIELLQQWIAAGMPSPEDEPVLAGIQDHWAYRPIVKPVVPGESPSSLPDGRGSDNPIDRLLAQHYAARKLEPLPSAESLTLLRRITFDLTGLPPTIVEQDEFLIDHSPAAYRHLVDNLLARPQHGERWARHWMDVWRYSDWDGYKDELRGSQRHIWRWRDWIVESLNAGKPYDRMIVEMLAGDEIAPEDPDVLRATGFLVRNFHKSNRNIWLDATVEHTAKGFLGLTVNCARCHDHKYDPIDQPEYYAFRAIFEPYQVRTERLSGQSDMAKDGLPRAYDADLAAATYVYLRGDEKQPDKEHPVAPAPPQMLDLPYTVEATPLPEVASFPALAEHIEREDLAAAESRLTAARQDWERLLQPTVNDASETSAVGLIDEHAVAVDRPPSPLSPLRLDSGMESARLKVAAAESEVVSLRARWAADRAKYGRSSPPEVDESTLAALASAAALAERASDVAAASRDLYSALLAHREAFTGKDAEPAMHQAAIQKRAEAVVKAADAFVKARDNAARTDDQYTSVGTAYPTTSTGRRLALAQWIVHPRNPLTARVAVNHVWLHHFGRPLVDNVFDFGLRTPTPPLVDVLDWLAAELIDSGWNLKHLHRLIVTSAVYQRESSADSSLLAHNAAVDPDNATWWRADVRRLEAEVIRDSLLAVAGKLDPALGGPDIDHDHGEQVYRRSLYFRHAYEKQMTMLTTFDAANPTDCYRRAASIVPQQALALANSTLSVSMARTFESRLAEQSPELSDGDFIATVFRKLLGRAPSPREAEACHTFLVEQTQLLTEPSRLTALSGPTKSATEPAPTSGRRARQNLVHTLMNHNDFVTVR